MFREMFATIAASTATVACALAVLGAGAGTAMAPEAGRLNANEPLYATTNDWAYGIYIVSQKPTYAFHLSNAWTPNYPYAAYAGYPCSKAAQPGGATLRGYIMVSGGLSRCHEY